MVKAECEKVCMVCGMFVWRVKWFKQSVKSLYGMWNVYMACGLVQTESAKVCMVCEMFAWRMKWFKQSAKVCMVCGMFAWRVKWFKQRVQRFVWHVECLYSVGNGSSRV